MENVPISDFAMNPPRQSRTAIAREDEKAVAAANIPLSLEASTDFLLIADVSFRKSSSIFFSITSDLMVLAPVIPSLKFPVILLLISRTWRFTAIIFFWKYANRSVTNGRIIITSSASLILIAIITTTEPTR